MTRHAAINARTARAFSIRRISSIRGPRSVVRRILKIRDSKYLFLKQTAFDARLRSWIEGKQAEWPNLVTSIALKWSGWLCAPFQSSQPCRERCAARFARCDTRRPRSAETASAPRVLRELRPEERRAVVGEADEAWSKAASQRAERRRPLWTSRRCSSLQSDQGMIWRHAAAPDR
jgi:hypothetical protein